MLPARRRLSSRGWARPNFPCCACDMIRRLPDFNCTPSATPTPGAQRLAIAQSWNWHAVAASGHLGELGLASRRSMPRVNLQRRGLLPSRARWSASRYAFCAEAARAPDWAGRRARAGARGAGRAGGRLAVALHARGAGAAAGRPHGGGGRLRAAAARARPPAGRHGLPLRLVRRSGATCASRSRSSPTWPQPTPLRASPS